MKIREILVLLGASIITFAFIGLMYDFYLRTEEIQLVKKNIYYDSLLLEQQNELMEKDSIIEQLIINEDQKIKSRISNHNLQLIKIKEKLDSLEEN